MNKWIIVSSKTGSNFYEYEGTGNGLKKVKSLENPEGKLKNSDLYSDNPGKAVSQGSGQFAMANEVDAKTKVVEKFAKEIAKELGNARKANSFSRLIMVSEPGFMGQILKELDDKTSSLIYHKLNKDLYHMPEKEIHESLKDVLSVQI